MPRSVTSSGSTAAPRWSPVRVAGSVRRWPGAFRRPGPRCSSPTSTRTPRWPPRNPSPPQAVSRSRSFSTCATRRRRTQAAAAAAELGGGALHILVNNAGAIAPAMFADLAEEKFRRVVDIHLVGTFIVQPGRAAAPAGRRHRPHHQRDFRRGPHRDHRAGQLRRPQRPASSA